MALKVRKLAQPPVPPAGPDGPPGQPPPPGGPPPGGAPPGSPGADGAPSASPPGMTPGEGLRPRVPGPSDGPNLPPGGLGGGPQGGNAEVTIDSQTGEIHLSKGQVNITVSKKTEADYPSNVWQRNDRSDAWEEAFGMKNQVTDYEEDPLHKDTHDNPFAGPKNRMKPPTFEITATAQTDSDAEAWAYAIQTTYALTAKVDGRKIVVPGVFNPLPIIMEAKTYGMDAEVTKNADLLTKDFHPGLKVAVLNDFPDMGYLYDPDVPALATVIARVGDEYLLEHEEWGRFYADENEIGVL